MDIASLGVNAGIVVAIIGLCEVVKKLPLPKVVVRFYVLLPLVFAAIAALVLSNPLVFREFIKTTFIYFGVSHLFYKVVLKQIKGMLAESKYRRPSNSV